jgi:MFS family permease
MENQQTMRISPSENEEKTPVTGYAWVVFFVAYAAAFVCGLNFMKISPVMPDLMTYFKIGLSSAGMTMAVFALVMLILGLPSGIFVQKYGIKTVAIAAMACSVIGSALGALSTNYTVFLISRGCEGIGFMLIALVTLTVAGIWFPSHKMGFAMGLANTYMGVSGFVALAGIPWVAHRYGWISVWWLTAALSFISLLSVIAFVRMPPWMSTENMAARGAKAPSILEGFANRNIWLWAAADFCVFFPVTVLNFYITYLHQVRGYTLQRAGLVSSLSSVGLLFGAPLAGILIGKFGHHLKATFSVGIVIYCLLLLVAFNITGIAIPFWMVVMGALGSGFLPTVIMTAVPGIMGSPQTTGMGIAIAGFGICASLMISPVFFGAVVERAGWNAGLYALIPVGLMGIVFASMTKIKK